MYQAILSSSDQFLEGLKIAKQVVLPKGPFNSIIMTGMGGSSLVADLVNDILGHPCLSIVRDYGLPSWVGKKDLVICASYSGNTEETLFSFEETIKKNIPLIVLAHGGKLKEKAKEKNIPFIQIPESLQPRLATGYFFSSLIYILSTVREIKWDVQQTLGDLSLFLKQRLKAQEEIGKQLAKEIKSFVPLIYAPTDLFGVARIWKIKMNENAKVQSFFNTFPEVNHNEMVGFTQTLMQTAIIYLKKKSMHPQIFKRMQVMEGLLKYKMPFFHVGARGSNLLQESFDLLSIADFTTYFLAQNYGIDPVPVHLVEEFKEKLK